MKDRKIIAIVGPTASGKTGIGVRLAKELNGEIISADSRQVYRGLDIGSGKEHFPDIKQWLIDIVSPRHTNFHLRGGKKEGQFSVFDWLPLARMAIEDIFSRGKVPIVVGGTGLYVQALVEGFQLEGITNYELRITENGKEDLNNLTLLRPEATRGAAIGQLNNLLQQLDPQAYAQVDKSNPHRLIRAIERARQGLKPVKVKPDFEVLQIGIDLPRDELYQRIDQRVEDRFDQGMLEEVIGLLKSGVDAEWLIRLGLEYRIITKSVLENSDPPALQDRIKNNEVGITDQEKGDSRSLNSLFLIRYSGVLPIANRLKSLPQYETMKQELKYKIHAFARRQLTWFRRFPEIKWLSDYDQIQAEAKNFLS